MGVKGLWQLLEPAGKAISPELLSGKILAVDISMWLHQFSKGIRDSEGNPLAKAHLIGLFKRICKLLFYGIKPVFVFDGSVPILKKQTIARRQQKREQACMDSRRTAKKLLVRLLQKHAIKSMKGLGDEDLAEIVEKKGRSKRNEEDLFILPSTEYPLQQEQDDCASNRLNAMSTESEQQEDDHDSLLARFGFHDEVDFDSEAFKSLPASLRLEMLLDHKDRSRKLNHGELWKIPKNIHDFSKYQLERVMEFNKITERIEALRREVNEDDEIAGLGSWRIASNDETRFTLRKKRGRNQPHEDVFAKRLHSNEPQESSKSEVCRQPYSILTEASLSNFYTSEIKNPMDKRFVVVPALAQEMDRKTSSLNFLRWKRKDDEDAEEDEEETKNIGVLKLKNIDSDNSDDGDDEEDFIEVKLLSPVRQVDDGKHEKISALNPSSANHGEVLLGNQVSETNWTNIKTKDLTDENSDKTIDKHAIASDDNDNSNCHEEMEKSTSVECMNTRVEMEPTNFTCIETATTSNKTFATTTVEEASTEVESAKTPTGIEENLRTDVANDNLEEEDYDDDELLSEVLESCKNDSEITLDTMEQKLTIEVDRLKEEMGRNERLATTITEQMHHEVQDLLRLFGMPYLVSPAEAEAQCAFLDSSGQTEGTITDDSDVFLFGAKRVVRHLFDRDEVSEVYSSEEIERKLSLNQSNLICMAMLCGCDYTDGIRGVGPVTATEIIQEFKDHDLDCLVKFRDWWIKAKKQKRPPENETKVKLQLRRLHLFEGFPNPSVFEAYKNPNVDTTLEPFTWSPPELELLEEFAIKTLNWSKKQADDMIAPLAKKLRNNSSQKHMTDYFDSTRSWPSLAPLGKKLRSQRVKRIVNLRKAERRKEQMVVKEEVKSQQDVPSRNQRSTKEKICKTSAKARKQSVVVKEMNLSEESSVDNDDIDDAVLAAIDMEEVVQKAKNMAK